MKKIIKIRRLKRPYSYCYYCNKDSRDEGHHNAPNCLSIDLPHGRAYFEAWLCDDCLLRLDEEFREAFKVESCK